MVASTTRVSPPVASGGEGAADFGQLGAEESVAQGADHHHQQGHQGVGGELGERQVSGADPAAAESRHPQRHRLDHRRPGEGQGGAHHRAAELTVAQKTPDVEQGHRRRGRRRRQVGESDRIEPGDRQAPEKQKEQQQAEALRRRHQSEEGGGAAYLHQDLAEVTHHRVDHGETEDRLQPEGAPGDRLGDREELQHGDQQGGAEGGQAHRGEQGADHQLGPAGEVPVEVQARRRQEQIEGENRHQELEGAGHQAEAGELRTAQGGHQHGQEQQPAEVLPAEGQEVERGAGDELGGRGRSASRLLRPPAGGPGRAAGFLETAPELLGQRLDVGLPQHRVMVPRDVQDLDAAGGHLLWLERRPVSPAISTSIRHAGRK